MKIGMISLYLPSEDKIGAGYQAHYMANALVRAGHAVTMFSPARRPDDALYEHHLVDTGNSMRTFRFAWNLRRMNWSKFDVIHATGDDYWLWGRRKPCHVRTMMGSCLSEALHIPGLREKTRMFMLGLTEILATRVAHRTVCISENTRRYYPWLKDVIVCGVDLEAFRPDGKKEQDPTILFVGTYQNRKRGKLLMEAFATTVRPALPNAKLWMVCGDAPSAPGVEVLGRLSTFELTERFRRAWVFCLPSSYEGFGVPYIEALAAGTPVIATPNVGALEVLKGGEYGKIVESEDLGGALLHLLTHDQERDDFAKKGLEYSQRFAWEKVVEQYEQIYADILSRQTRKKRSKTISQSSSS